MCMCDSHPFCRAQSVHRVWMFCSWRRRPSLLQVHQIGRNKALNMLSERAIPCCSSCPRNCQSGLLRTWKMSWSCPPKQGQMVPGVQWISTAFYCGVALQTQRATTYTPLTPWSLSRTCTAESCVLVATLLIWMTTVFTERISRWFRWNLCIHSYTYTLYIYYTNI